MRFSNVFSLILLVFIVSGCGDNEKKPQLIKVTGTVTHTSGPVDKGVISFVSNGTSVGDTAELAAGGAYTVNVTAGDYTVVITPKTIKLPDTASGPGGDGFEEAKNIPDKYRSQGSSTLKASVAEGKDKYDFKLE